jgi:hypothetical protein
MKGALQNCCDTLLTPVEIRRHAVGGMPLQATNLVREGDHPRARRFHSINSFHSIHSFDWGPSGGIWHSFVTCSFLKF